MIACCDSCGVKYISEEGQVSNKFVENKYGEGFKIVKKLSDDPQVINWYKSLKAEQPQSTFAIKDDIQHEVCTCDCHIVGLMVFH